MNYTKSELKNEVLAISFLIPTVLDTLTINTVFEELEGAVEQFQSKRILLDFGQASLLTSEMLGKLLALRQSCLDQNATLKLCNLNEALINLLAITKLDTMFDAYHSEEAAMEEFSDEDLVRNMYSGNEVEGVLGPQI